MRRRWLEAPLGSSWRHCNVRWGYHSPAPCHQLFCLLIKQLPHPSHGTAREILYFSVAGPMKKITSGSSGSTRSSTVELQKRMSQLCLFGMVWNVVAWWLGNYIPKSEQTGRPFGIDILKCILCKNICILIQSYTEVRFHDDVIK